MPLSLSKLKVTPSFCFPFKIPDNPTALIIIIGNNLIIFLHKELYMMVEDRGKDEFSAQNLMKKHEALEAAVEDYRDNVRQLGEVARQLASEGHPQSEVIFLICSCHSSTNSRT